MEFLPVGQASTLPRWVEPSVVTEHEGQWRLHGTRCRDCDSRFFPRAYSCATCMGTAVEDHVISPEGELHVSALARATQPGFHAPARYGWVNIPADGVRVFAHIVPADGPDPEAGVPVVFDPVIVGADDDGPFCSIAFRVLDRTSQEG